MKHEEMPNKRLCEFLKSNVDSFDPYFSTRVMARVRTAAADQEAWITNLWKTFRRVAVTAALAACILVAHNISTQWQYRSDSNAMEMILGIPPATFATTIQYVGLWL
ncbi:hypothetical protein EHM69_05720 [candidate division KSB1 bacterium]|nr:MAG: hypothetical protein EHM69_05720 [candidate division KSB1 bacterium]